MFNESVSSILNQPLSFWVTAPRNITRLISLLEPLFELQKYIINTLEGKHPLFALTIAMSYFALCFWPRLFIFLPHLFIYTFSLHHYRVGRRRSSRSERQSTKNSISPKYFTDTAVRPPNFVNPAVSHNPKAFKHSDLNDAPVKRRDSFTGISENTDGLAVDPRDLSADSASIIELMQFSQNMMDLCARLLELIYSFLDSIDWTNHIETKRNLTIISCLLVPFIVVFLYLPYEWMFLAIGYIVFLHRLFSDWLEWLFSPLRSLKAYYLRNLLRSKLNDREITTKRNIDDIEELIAYNGKTRSIERHVYCFENQRWWLGLDFVPHLFTKERPLWSNEKGNHYLPKHAFVLPEGWSWKGEWMALASPKLTDEEGWEYGDTTWINFENRVSLSSLVKRRKWSRIMILDLAYASASEVNQLIQDLSKKSEKIE
jgi:hypothetical protein